VLWALRRSGGWLRSVFPSNPRDAIIALIGQHKYDEYASYINLRPFAASRIPVTIDDTVAIWTYTSSDAWYERINEELWDDDPSAEVFDFSTVLDNSLSKMFGFNGVVFRGYTAEDLNEFLEPYRVGTTRDTPAFTSSTKDVNQAFVGNVLFVINSHTGPEIERFSAFQYEREILFPTNTKFRILAVEKTDDSAVIEIEQVGA
jgi:hypothetical protein